MLSGFAGPNLVAKNFNMFFFLASSSSSSLSITIVTSLSSSDDDDDLSNLFYNQAKPGEDTPLAFDFNLSVI